MNSCLATDKLRAVLANQCSEASNSYNQPNLAADFSKWDAMVRDYVRKLATEKLI
jgi:hypothetical protein